MINQRAPFKKQKSCNLDGAILVLKYYIFRVKYYK